MCIYDIKNLKCNICDDIFNNKYALKRHFIKSKTHQKKLTELNIINEIPIWEKESRKRINLNIEIKRSSEINIETEVCSIPMKNKDGILVGFTDVDTLVIDSIIHYAICLNDGYAHIIVNGKPEPLHQYIYYTIYGNKKIKDRKVDHSNRRKLDNRITNLDQVTNTVNSRNRTKSQTATSQYWGVSKSHNQWRMHIKDDDNKRYEISYQHELHAAWHYNLMVTELNLKGYNLNNIKEPEGFIRKLTTEEEQLKKKLPVGIHRDKDKYFYRFNLKRYRFNTIEEALIDKNIRIANDKKLKKETSLKNDVKRNDKGIAVIDIFNRKKVKVCEIMVEDSVYDELMKVTLTRCKEDYINILINGNQQRLGRYLKNCTDPDLKVDHRDGNVFNYLEKNLKITTALENGQNKGSAKNSSSQYVGVTYNKFAKKWYSNITFNKPHHLGSFSTEKEACIARDLKALEINNLGNNYRINLSAEELQPYLFIKSLSEEHFDFNYLFFYLP